MSDTIIDLKNVNVFHKKNLLLNNVNLNVKRGEFVYLIGKTGTGKSSIMSLLYGELPMPQGEGYVAGFELHNLKMSDIPKLRRKLGIIFQDFQLLTDRTAKENLMF